MYFDTDGTPLSERPNILLRHAYESEPRQKRFKGEDRNKLMSGETHGEMGWERGTRMQCPSL